MLSYQQKEQGSVRWLRDKDVCLSRNKVLGSLVAEAENSSGKRYEVDDKG